MNIFAVVAEHELVSLKVNFLHLYICIAVVSYLLHA